MPSSTFAAEQAGWASAPNQTPKTGVICSRDSGEVLRFCRLLPHGQTELCINFKYQRRVSLLASAAIGDGGLVDIA